jgi:hypothetical protein
VQDVLLHESAVKELAIENLVAAIGRGVDEPGDDPQRPLPVAVAVSNLPDNDVGVPQLLHHRDIALLDSPEQAVGHVGDGFRIRDGHICRLP